MLKKIMSILLGAAMLLCAAACESTGANSSAGSTTTSGRIKIVTTVFAEYDWVREIAGTHTQEMELIYLPKNGVDMHSYQPSVDDMINISDCTMFIYVGGESDGWVEDAVSRASNKNMKVLCLMDILGESAKTEEHKEGMQGEEEKTTDEEPEYDEHVWLSLRNAALFCKSIETALSEIDPGNAADYAANTQKYLEELDTLDKSFADLFSQNKPTLIFADRFPFRYFTDDYGIDYFAAFSGCSAETEASFETLAFLTAKVTEIGCHTIYTIEGSDQSLANTIIRNANTADISVAELNSIQSVSEAQITDGASYLGIMQQNYKVLSASTSSR